MEWLQAIRVHTFFSLNDCEFTSTRDLGKISFAFPELGLAPFFEPSAFQAIRVCLSGVGSEQGEQSSWPPGAHTKEQMPRYISDYVLESAFQGKIRRCHKGV